MSEPLPSGPEHQPTTVRILTSRFDRLNELRGLVDRREQEVDGCQRDLKEAKASLEAARQSFDRETRRLLDFVKGVDDLPLFANMSEAIDAATADPVVDRLMRRLQDVGVDHVNILIIAGYTEEERGQVTQWLDALARRGQALADLASGKDVVVPSEPEMPPFLKPQTPDSEEELPPPALSLPTDQVIREALPHGDLELTDAQIAKLSLRQRWDLLTWIARVKHVKAEKGDALVFDDLPPALPFLAELAVDEEPAEPLADDIAADPVDDDASQPTVEAGLSNEAPASPAADDGGKGPKKKGSKKERPRREGQ